MLTSTGSILYSPFISKGAIVNLNNLYANAGPNNYQPNGWAILQDLGINTIDVRGGCGGQWIYRWDPSNDPTNWANNFEAFLAQADSHGIKVMFSMLGDYWGGLFGITCPEPYGGFAGITVAQAKTLIDMLAGANSLNHNFFADPRIMMWSSSNEVDIGNSVTRDWVLQTTGYMRSKGAKVFVSCPRNSQYSADWMGGISFQAVEPVLRGHVDYMSYHDYRIYEYVLAKNAAVARGETGQTLYNTLYSAAYNLFKADLQNSVLNARGLMSAENIVWGEFGLWIGYDSGAGIGLPATFTDADRGAYYSAVYQVAKDLGIKHMFNFLCFQQIEGGGNYQRRYEIVDVGGVYFTTCTSVLQQYYG
jgi:hypothetical protein